MRKGKKFSKLIALSLSAVLLLGVSAVQAADRKVEWNFVSMMMNTHPVVANAMIPLFEKFKKESNGKFEITVYNPETLLPTAELHQGIQRGLADIGCITPSRYPNDYPIATLGDYPLLFQTARAASYTMWAMYENNPQLQKEFSKAPPVAFTSSTPLDLVSTKPIHNLADLKGLRVGVLDSSSVKLIQLLGGVPILLNLSDMYISLQRGMVKAVMSPIPTYRSTKVCEVGKYVIKCNLKCSITPTIINPTAHDSLPPDIKAILDKITLGANIALQSNWVEISTDKDLKWLIKNNGIKIIEITPEEINRWHKLVEPMYADWIKLAQKNGVKNPEKILADMRSYAKKYNNVENQIAETAKYKELLGDLYVNFKEN